MRKLFGILLIILGWFVSLCGLLAAIPNIMHSIKEQTPTENKVAFIIGTLIGVLVISLISYILIRLGMRLLKTRKEKLTLTDKIESIR